MMNSLLALDVAEMWFSHLPVLCLFNLVARGKESKDQDAETAMVVSVISGRIAADVAAIRLLISHGADVQARQILRGVSENIDALGRACIDREFCSDFISGQDVEETNSVWHKYIYKSKAKKYIYKFVESKLGKEYNNTWYAHRNEEEMVLSASVHVSYLSGFMSLIPDFGEDEGGGISGDIRTASLRTVKYCNARCAEHAFFDVVVFKAVESISSQIPATVRSVRTSYAKRACLVLRQAVIETNLFLWGMRPKRIHREEARHDPAVR